MKCWLLFQGRLMHELAVCQGLLKQVGQIAARHQAREVETIYLQVGPLSGVEPELLKAAFPCACSGTIASNARLVIHPMPVRVYCQSCETETEARPDRLLCASCGDTNTRLIGGDELLLESIEMHTDH